MKLLPYVCVPFAVLGAAYVNASHVKTITNYTEALGSPKVTYALSTSTSEWEFVTNTPGLTRFATSYDWTYTGQPAKPLIFEGTAYSVQGNMFSNGSAATNTVLSLNLESGAVTQVAELGINYAQSNSTVQYKGRLFTIGGGTNAINYALNSLVEYDPKSGTWYQLQNAPLARYGGIAQVYEDNIYYLGGWGFNTINKVIPKIDEDGFFYTELLEEPSWQTDIQKYDIENDKWEVLGSIPKSTVFTDSAIISDTVYFTELSTSTTSNTEITTFNIKTKSWDIVALPSPLFNTSITKVENVIAVYGRLSPNANDTNWNLYFYNTLSNQWSTARSLPENRVQAKFRLVGYKDYLYYIGTSTENDDTQIYKLRIDDVEIYEETYQEREPQHIVSSYLNNNNLVSTSDNGQVVNLVLGAEKDYDLIRWSPDNTEQRNAIRRVTQSLYEKFPDRYDFIYLLLNEDDNHENSRSYGYHTPVLNDIEGIGQGVFDFSSSYGSNSRLQSIIVLPTKFDLIHGPSLHEIMHRWGNYLKFPLESLRHRDWLGYSETQQYHFGYLSSGGQLGGWKDDFFYSLDTEDTYLLSDAPEGVIGFSGLGPGNNSVKYSNLELYLMGALPINEVPDLLEPSTQPVETPTYPIYQIGNLNTITAQSILENNGERIPSYTESPKQFDTLFVVLSKTPLKDSDWHNYEHQVKNFTRKGEDNYFRLYNFWEATNGLACLDVPDSRLHFTDYQVDSDGDGLFDFQEQEIGTDIYASDSDSDGISDYDEVQYQLDPLDSTDAEADFDSDGLTNKQELTLRTDIRKEDSDGDGISDGREILLGLDPLNPNDAQRAPQQLILQKGYYNEQPLYWLKHSISPFQATFENIDRITFNSLQKFDIEHPFDTPSLHILDDIDDDSFKELGIFGLNKNVDRYQLHVFDGKTGQPQGILNWPSTLRDVAFKVIDDLTGDGKKDYAIKGVHKNNGSTQLVVKNWQTKQTHRTYKWVDNWKDTQIITMSDITYDGIPEVALYGKHRRLDKGQLFILNGHTADKLSVYNWNALWSDTQLFEMEDLDGDGTLDWGQYGKRKDDGRLQWVVKKGHDKRGVIRIFSWPAGLDEAKPMLVNDMTGDGIKEVAVTGRVGSNKLVLRINDGRMPNQRIANHSWSGVWTNESIVELGDLTKDGISEVALLGKSNNSHYYQIAVNNGADSTEISRIWLLEDWVELEIESYDVNQDNIEDIIINGITTSPLTRKVTILNGEDFSQLYETTF